LPIVVFPFIRRFLLMAALSSPSVALAQTTTAGAIGSLFPYQFPGETFTIVDAFSGATLDGTLTTATFVWSAGPCPTAAKIKLFRPREAAPEVVELDFVDERGPFDVPASSTAPVTVSVTLDPPMPVRHGDLLGIANVGGCGAPELTTIGNLGTATPTAYFFSGDFSGDWRGTAHGALGGPSAAVKASGPSDELGLLQNRFAVTLAATDPRTGTQTIGTPVSLEDGAGYFSLPDFTGDPKFPEVMVKMVDATGAPQLGGTFWFFQSPLTDVEYVLTVKDQLEGAVRTYSRSGPAGASLCGSADTSAFPP
jgi:hypothetical protein